MSQTIAPDMTDSFDSSIPVLNDVIVPGRPERARPAPHAPEPVLAFVPPVIGSAESAGTAEHQADVIADRLRGRFTHFLTGSSVTRRPWNSVSIFIIPQTCTALAGCKFQVRDPR